MAAKVGQEPRPTALPPLDGFVFLCLQMPSHAGCGVTGLSRAPARAVTLHKHAVTWELMADRSFKINTTTVTCFEKKTEISAYNRGVSADSDKEG